MKTLIILCWISMTINQEIINTPTDNFDLIVNVIGIDSEDGKIRVGLYNSSGTWLGKAFMGETGEISHGTAKVKFTNVPKGKYGISLYHDENDNGKLDTGIFGIPKEDYACSNGAKGRFGPPKWKDAVFNLEYTKDILIKL